jgi:hypothetical protein
VRDASRETRRAYDPWPVFVALKALAQYAEWQQDPRVIPAMLACCRRLRGVLDETPLFAWARSRWADLVVALHWLAEQTGEPWLLDLALTARTQGYDWRRSFESFEFTERVGRAELARARLARREEFEDFYMATHGVNNAMGVKAPAVAWRETRDSADRDAVRLALETLDRWHGQPNGLFSCDEHLAGPHPSQGTELCSVVELMYSLETALSILGTPALGDRLEKAAYNALPATFTPDMWAHQYDQQANQVLCASVDDPIYTNNGPRSNLFGLEPQFGCCTANLHQGWPKLVSHLWMQSADGGLAAAVWGPCVVDTEVRGTPVHVEVETDYPFDGDVAVRVTAYGALEFPLHLRIPAWAAGAELRPDGERRREAAPGAFCTLRRTWSGTSEILLRLPMPPRILRGFRGSASIERGPLVFSLAIDEAWRLVAGTPPAADWEVHPRSPWNYALDLAGQDALRFERRPAGKRPFSPEGAPVAAAARGRRVPGWGIERGAAAAPPESPLPPDAVEGPPVELRLLPYGATRLRVTALPVLG